MNESGSDELLTQQQARLLLKRASEIEIAGAPISYSDLKIAATEAGISPAAFQMAADMLFRERAPTPSVNAGLDVSGASGRGSKVAVLIGLLAVLVVLVMLL